LAGDAVAIGAMRKDSSTYLQGESYACRKREDQIARRTSAGIPSGVSI
jgi:hypothetical protein